MKEKRNPFKLTYNGIRLFWILMYLVYMFFFGFTTYQSINGLVVERSTYLVNLFNTLYNQNAIQMVSNPENFDRVLVSDIEGEILLQYGELIPAITNLEYNSLFEKLQTEKIVLSNFYYDPIIDQSCFDMGIIEKNRVYIGTLSANKFLQDNLENLRLDHFLIFDSNSNGYLYEDSGFSSLSYFEREKINWINNVLFISDNTLYFSHTESLNNFRLVAYLPFIKEILPAFIYSIIPFCLGLLIIFFTEHKNNTENKNKKNRMEEMLIHIIKKSQVPETLLNDKDMIKSDLFRKLNEKFINYENYKKDMKRYVEKLSSFSEQTLELKMDIDYLDKYFYNLVNQEEIDFSESIQTLFRIAFEKNERFCQLILKINDKTVFSKEPEELGNKLTTGDDYEFNYIELGRYKIDYYVDFCQNIPPEITQIRKTSFELFSRYMALIYSIKRGFNPEELSLTKNFSTFSEMVEREIDKVKRYNDEGILFYLELINFSLIKEKYGVSVAKIIVKRISEIIISEIRNSDIVGVYKEGTFLVYFCNLNKNHARIKIEDICSIIYNDAKIKQIGINIDLKSLIASVDKNTKTFDRLLLKCLQVDA